MLRQQARRQTVDTGPPRPEADRPEAGETVDDGKAPGPLVVGEQVHGHRDRLDVDGTEAAWQQRQED